jgi:hypothetical protein
MLSKLWRAFVASVALTLIALAGTGAVSLVVVGMLATGHLNLDHVATFVAWTQEQCLWIAGSTATVYAGAFTRYIMPHIARCGANWFIRAVAEQVKAAA